MASKITWNERVPSGTNTPGEAVMIWDRLSLEEAFRDLKLSVENLRKNDQEEEIKLQEKLKAEAELKRREREERETENEKNKELFRLKALKEKDAYIDQE